jgi:hypothetical protein
MSIAIKALAAMALLVTAEQPAAPNMASSAPSALSTVVEPPCPPAGCPIPVPYPPVGAAHVIAPIKAPTGGIKASSGNEAGVSRRTTSPSPPSGSPPSSASTTP